MAKRMLIDALHPEETRVVIADDKQIFDFDFVASNKKPLKGNVYLAKITRVEPSLQAAFVEYGGNKQGFLPFSEIHADYYQIPVSDRERLLEEDAKEDISEETDDTSAIKAPDTNEEPAPTSELGGKPFPEGHTPSVSNNVVSITANKSEPYDVSRLEHAQNVLDTKAQSAPVENIATQEGATTETTTQDIPPLESNTPEDSADGKQGKEPQPAEGVETIANEEEEIQDSRKKNRYFRRYKIQEVIRRGQVVLVQVIKEERGNKGASLTSYLSLAGRYCVLMPNSPKDGGISRKIASTEDRKRLKAISTELRLAQGMSVIIRTAGMDRTHAEIKRDYDYLVKLWNHIREDTLKSNAPSLIYEEGDVLKRAIRDQYTQDIDEVLIQGEAGYKNAKDFMKLLLPSHTPKIKHYKKPTPLFYAYDIEEQLLSMHDEVVKLKSGGYIVINPTEALISIDVNSGRATGERNIEETATKTNLEAAVEVARQLRLRDLAGLIVIDFIDMLEGRHRRSVEKTLKEALKADRAKIQLGRISPFGLLEMSRQRLRSSISETNMVQCPHCVGRGHVRSNDSMAIQMIRAIEKEASSSSWSGLRLIAPQAIALHLLNTKRDILRSIEERHNITIQVLIDTNLTTSDYNLEKMRRSNSDRGSLSEHRVRKERTRKTASDTSEEAKSDKPNTAETDDDTAEKRPRRTRTRRPRRSPRKSNDASVEATESNTDSTQSPTESKADEAEKKPRTRSRSPRRPKAETTPSDKAAKTTNDNQPTTKDADSLPSFAKDKPVPPAEPKKKAVNAPTVMKSTPRDPSVPAKKGWWQKMIELDD